MVRAIVCGAAATSVAAAFGLSPLLALLLGEVAGIMTLAYAPRRR